LIRQSNHLKLSQLSRSWKSALFLFPSPRWTKGWYDIVYCPFDWLISFFYWTYKQVIDKEYQLNRYDNRYRESINLEIAQVYGEEWGYIANLCDNKYFFGIVIRMFLDGIYDPFKIREYIENFEKLYYSVKLTQVLAPYQYIIISGDPPMNNSHIRLLSDLRGIEFIPYNYKKIIKNIIDMCDLDTYIEILPGPYTKFIAHTVSVHERVEKCYPSVYMITKNYKKLRTIFR